MKGTEQSKQKITQCIFINIISHSYKTKLLQLYFFFFSFNAIDLSQMFLLWMLWIKNMNKYLQIFMAHKLVIFSQFLQKRQILNTYFMTCGR